MNATLADVVLLVHFGFVLFVVGGLALIWIGAWRRWRWVRGRGFRLAHLCAIALVAIEQVVGIACPLTVWEDALRHAGTGDTGFVARWVGRLLYYDFPGWVFTVVYLGFALVVAVMFVAFPPHVQTMSRRKS